MRFSDFVIYHALQENNRCLHLLSAYPAPLSDTSVHSLRIGVKRLRASWRLLQREVPEALFNDAEARLTAIHRTLAPARDEHAVLTMARGLAAKTSKKKTHAALTIVANTLGEHVAGPITRASMDQVSDGFQQESGVWRDLDVETLRRCTSDRRFRALLSARSSPRPPRSRARRCGTDASLAALGEKRVLPARHDSPGAVRRQSRTSLVSRPPRRCTRQTPRPVAAARPNRRRDARRSRSPPRGSRSRSRSCRRTATAPANCTPTSTREKGAAFGQAVTEDIARLSFDNVVVLPRSA